MLNAQERFVDSGPVRSWTERTGDPDDPAVLMVMGSAPRTWRAPRWAA
ncbi:hypothetical protein WBK31_17015 [Nonomuraea sp. N2-4H]|jgi:hypothetical protein